MVLSSDGVVDDAAVDEVMGPDEGGGDLEERARRSERLFVRSQTHVALWSPEAEGPRLTAFECLQAFGWEVMSDLAARPATPIVRDGCAAGPLVRKRRESLGLDLEDVAGKAGIAAAALATLEEGRRSVPARTLLAVAQVLALDTWRIGAMDAEARDDLGVRLRQMRKAIGLAPDLDMFDLVEAAWIVATQNTLRRWLRRPIASYATQVRVGSAGTGRRAAWSEGRDLARETRLALRIGPSAPIPSVATLAARRFGLPVVFMRLGDRMAGAVLAEGGGRGIVVNVAGINRNPGTLRVTIAHELCHALFDSETQLHRLRLPTIALDVAGEATTWGEARAQAFAAELLLPSEVAASRYRLAVSGRAGLTALVSTYGVSFTCARRQIDNAAAGGAGRDLRAEDVAPPSQTWRAAEVPEAPPGSSVPLQRRGGFEEACLEAYRGNLISADTATHLLRTTGRSLAAKPGSEDGQRPGDDEDNAPHP